MRILILSSSTGGGHDMRARSLSTWCRVVDADITVERYQALEESSAVYGFGVNIYNWIQKKCPTLHHIYFNFLEVFRVSASQHTLLGKAKFVKRLKEANPDLIVSVHAHTNHAFRAIAKSMLPELRFVTYCGEMHGGYGFSKHWVDRGGDAFIGATPEICDAAEELGMPKDRIVYGGFLLNPNFYSEPLAEDKQASLLRDTYHLEPGRFTLLLSTGANGALNHPDFLRALDTAQLPLQVIALCGRNESARSDIDTLSRNFSSITVRTLGYQEDMFPLMQCVDGIVARPGTGTTSEAIMAGCPIFLNAMGGIMPQEWITVKFLRKNGLKAPLIRKSGDLVELIKQRLESSAAQNNAVDQMRKLRPKSTPREIVEYLRNLTFQSHKNPLG